MAEEGSKSTDFFSPQEAKELAGAIDRIIDYVVREGIGHIVLGGSSAAYARDLFRMRWRHRFPTKDMPRFFALGKAVNSVFCGGESAAYLQSGVAELKDLGKWGMTMGRFRAELVKKFGSGFFATMQSERVLLFDEFDNSTDAIGALKEILHEATGARDIRKGLLIGHNKGIPPGLDVLGMRGDVPRFYAKRNFLLTRMGKKRPNREKDLENRILHDSARAGFKKIARTRRPR